MSANKEVDAPDVNTPIPGDETITVTSGEKILLSMSILSSYEIFFPDCSTLIEKFIGQFYAKCNNYGMKFFWAKCFLNFQGLCLNGDDCPWKHSMMLENIPDDPLRCLAIIGHSIHWEYYLWLELVLNKIVSENRFDKSILINLVNQAKNEDKKKKLIDIIKSPKKH